MTLGPRGAFKAEQGAEATTVVVSADEPCFYLAEANLPAQDGRGKDRFQVLKVVRRDRLVTAYVRLGPAKGFHADLFNMLGGVVGDNGKGQAYHTVAELQEAAEELRSRPPHRVQELGDLQGLYRNSIEETKKLARHASTFAAGGNLVRP